MRPYSGRIVESMRLPISLFVLLLAALPASAQENDVPYWASLRSDEVNMRVGPSPNYPIEWVYHRAGLPVLVVRVNQGWRLVRDPDGAEGWISSQLLTRTRGAIVTGDALADMTAEKAEGSAVRWRAQPGVVGKLGECSESRCEFDVGGRRGWILRSRIWGEGEP